MSAEENASNAQAEFDQEVDALLSDLLCDDGAYWSQVVRCRQAAAKFAGAVAEWAPETDPTLQVAKLGEKYPHQFENLLFFVSQYRRRQAWGDAGEGSGSGIPASPAPTAPPGVEARPLPQRPSEGAA